MNPKLKMLVQSFTRLIYVVVDEEDRFIKTFHEEYKKSAARTWVYNSAFGLNLITNYIRDWDTRAHHVNTDCQSIHDALIHIYKDDPKDKESIYLITDPDRYLKDEQVVRRIMNIVHQTHHDSHIVKMLILVGPKKFIPEKLLRYVEVVEDRGMSDEEMGKEVARLCEVVRKDVPASADQLFRGMTSYEAEQAIVQSMVITKQDETNPKRIDPAYISNYKRNQLDKTDLIQWVDTSKVTLDKVGGLQRFKKWGADQKACWSEEGKKFGLRVPRGVLFVGVYGCGKSLATKALATMWGMPLIQLEIGKLMSSGVGESENNLYRALRMIENVSPCVTGETEVTLADGNKKPIQVIWEEFISKHPDSAELNVRCWNEKTLRVENTRVKAITKREAEAFRIEAANGFYLNATANHQHYVLRGGMPEWVRTDELNPSDMLAVPVDRYEGLADCSRFQPLGMRDYTDSQGNVQLRRGGGGFRDAVVPKLPNTWSTDLGWLLGVIEGDGFIGLNEGIGLTNSTVALLDKFESSLFSIFGLKTGERRLAEPTIDGLPGLTENPEFKDCWTTMVTNQLAAEFLRTARDHILTAPYQVRAAYYAGWVDADGCVTPEKVTLTVKHPLKWFERRALARNLVQSLGVTPSNFEVRNMEVTGTRAVSLASIIGEYLVSKSEKALRVTSSAIGFDRGMGFACGQVLCEARKSSGLLHRNLPMSSNTTWTYENGKVPISERHLRTYIESYGEAGQDLKNLLDAPCRWVAISSISSVGIHEVFDLACEGEDTHSFFANGMITHNCVVWVDEAEKSLAGSQSSGRSDAGTTSRVLGILSTWIQETKAEVCLAMTANSLATLPVEIVNRMTERFFVDLPSEEDRVDIIKIHLAEFRQDSGTFDLALLAEKSANMVGREISQAIEQAMTKSFVAKKPALDQDILIQEFESKPRIIKTMGDEIKAICDWVGYDPVLDDGIRARLASDKRSETFKLVEEAGK